MSKTHIAVVGSRDWGNYQLVANYLRTLSPTDVVIVSGGARGVDTLAVNYAKHLGIETVIMPAQWDKYRRKAGMIRNSEMIKQITKVIAFWDGQSVGTKNMIDRAVKAKHVTTVIVYTPDGKRAVLKETDNR